MKCSLEIACKPISQEFNPMNLFSYKIVGFRDICSDNLYWIGQDCWFVMHFLIACCDKSSKFNSFACIQHNTIIVYMSLLVQIFHWWMMTIYFMHFHFRVGDSILENRNITKIPTYTIVSEQTGGTQWGLSWKQKPWKVLFRGGAPGPGIK